MYIVGIYTSFGCEMPMHIFDTEQKAKDFIRDCFLREVLVAEQEEENLKTFNANDDFSWARIDYESDEDDFVEWNIGSIYDKR